MNETKEMNIIKGAPLVKEPTLIKVKTISPKIVEQMSFIDGNAYDHDVKVDLGNLMADAEIIGKLQQYGTLVVRKGGQLFKMRSIAYLQYLMEGGVAHDEAVTQMGNLPQLFEA